MISERELKSEVRRALDGVLPPTPWLETAVSEHLQSRLGSRKSRQRETHIRLAFGSTAMALVGIAVAAAILVSQLYAPRPVPSGTSGLTPAEQIQLAALEARPLNFPSLLDGGLCPDPPRTLVHPWSSPADFAFMSGTGPVYLPFPAVSVPNRDVAFYTDPSTRGVVLIRGRNLTKQSPILFFGRWSAGPALGIEMIEGQPVAVHAAVAVPADRPPHDILAAPGWGLWTVQWQTGFSHGDCVGFQIDMVAGSQVISFTG